MMRVQLYWLDEPYSRIAIMGRPRGGEWLEDELASAREQGVDILISLLTLPEVIELGLAAEPDLCQANQIRFLSLPIEDRGLPDNADGLRTLVDKLAEQYLASRAIAVHCRAGIGRSAMVVAAFICRLGCSPAEAFDRIARARGCPVPDTGEQLEWVEVFARTLCNKRREP